MGQYYCRKCRQYHNSTSGIGYSHRRYSAGMRQVKQTGKRKSIRLDRKRKAKLPGKRRSKSGKTYYETRKNRSDKKGKRI